MTCESLTSACEDFIFYYLVSSEHFKSTFFLLCSIQPLGIQSLGEYKPGHRPRGAQLLSFTLLHNLQDRWGLKSGCISHRPVTAQGFCSGSGVLQASTDT